MSSKWFSKFASYLSTMTGRPITFVLAVFLVIAWAVTGPLFHYSDTWHQHLDHDCHVSDGFSNSEHAEP